MNRTAAVLLALVALMPLAGCISDGVDGNDGAAGETGAQGLPGQDGANGLDGMDGMNGTNGADGTDGADGADGSNGTDGVDGKTTLIQTFIEYPGEFCVDGGVGLHVGIDDDSDAYLSIDEIDETVYVCNGADGQDGQDGDDGSDGSSGQWLQRWHNGMMLSDSIRLSKSDGCPAGGRLMAFGLDNGTTEEPPETVFWNPVKLTTRPPTAVTSGSASFTMHARGRRGANPWPTRARISIEDTLYFAADDGVHGYELWGLQHHHRRCGWWPTSVRGLGQFPRLFACRSARYAIVLWGLHRRQRDRIVGARSHGHHVDGRKPGSGPAIAKWKQPGR